MKLCLKSFFIQFGEKYVRLLLDFFVPNIQALLFWNVYYFVK